MTTVKGFFYVIICIPSFYCLSVSFTNLAIKKARECTEITKGEISELLQEQKELQQQSEALKHTKEGKGSLDGRIQQQHSVSYFVGLGTSLTAFGPPVPQSRVLEACRRLQVLNTRLMPIDFSW